MDGKTFTKDQIELLTGFLYPLFGTEKVYLSYKRTTYFLEHEAKKAIANANENGSVVLGYDVLESFRDGFDAQARFLGREILYGNLGKRDTEKLKHDAASLLLSMAVFFGCEEVLQDLLESDLPKSEPNV